MISLGQYVNFRRINPLMALLLLSRNPKISWKKLLPYTHIYRVEDLVDVIDSLTILEVIQAQMLRIGWGLGQSEIPIYQRQSQGGQEWSLSSHTRTALRLNYRPSIPPIFALSSWWQFCWRRRWPHPKRFCISLQFPVLFFFPQKCTCECSSSAFLPSRNPVS